MSRINRGNLRNIGYEVADQFRGGNIEESSDDDDDNQYQSRTNISRRNRDEDDSDSSEESSEEEHDESDSEEEEEEEEEEDRTPCKKMHSSVHGVVPTANIAVAANKTIDATLVKPQSRVETHIIEESLSPEFQKKIDKIVEGYEGTNAVIVVAPNWSVGKVGYPAHGFTLVADANSKINPICFDPIKFYSGTSVIKLNGAKFTDGRKVDMNSLLTNKDKILTILDTKFDGSASNFTPPSFDVISTQHHNDSVEWHPHVQEETGAFVTIDTTSGFDSSGRIPSRDYWLKIKTGATLASENLFQHIEDICSNDSESDKKKTWKEIFASSEVHKAKDLITRNRERLIYSVAEAIGLDVNTISAHKKEDTKAFKKAHLFVPEAETITNRVYFKKDKVFFAKGTVLVDNITKPIVFNENPFKGSYILKGPGCNKDQPYGLAWDIHYGEGNITKCAYPIDTGKVKSKPSFTGGIELDCQYYTWKGKEKSHPKLSPDIYRARDQKFLKKESELGRNHAWGEIALQPILTKMCES